MILPLLAEMIELKRFNDDYYYNDDTITYEYENTDPIVNRIMLVCKYHSDFCDKIVKQYSWYVAKVIFEYDGSHGQYMVKKIAFENTEGDFMVCDIGDDVLDDIINQKEKRLYFDMCDDLVENVIGVSC